MTMKKMHSVSTLHAMTLKTVPYTYTYGGIIFHTNLKRKVVSERGDVGERKNT